MRIAVLSDTHLREGKSLPSFVWKQLNQIDMIFHAGDLTHMGLLEELSCIAPVKAVRGNCDGWDVTLPDREVIVCEALKIGLIHGDAGKGKSTPERAYLAFKDTTVDLIVFGHSHALTWTGVTVFSCSTQALLRINDANFNIPLDYWISSKGRLKQNISSFESR